MSINQVTVRLARDVPVTRLGNTLEVGDEQEKGSLGVEKVHVRFNKHFHIEVKQKENDEVIIIMTSGGVSKEIDAQTFQQLITMNY